jgi:hypothetical protein
VYSEERASACRLNRLPCEIAAQDYSRATDKPDIIGLWKSRRQSGQSRSHRLPVNGEIGIGKGKREDLTGGSGNSSRCAVRFDMICANMGFSAAFRMLPCGLGYGQVLEKMVSAEGIEPSTY